MDQNLPQVHELIGNIFAEYGYVLDLDGVDAHLRNPGPEFRATGGEFWVMLDGKRVIATSGVRIAGDAAEIKTIYVARPYRRRRLGRFMTELAIDHAWRIGITRLFLWSDTKFAEAHRMYESMGFRRTDIRHFVLPTPFSEYRYDRSSAASGAGGSEGD